LASHQISQRPEVDRCSSKNPVGAAATELDGAQMPDPAQHTCDPPPRPRERILNIGERSRLVGRDGERVEQLPLRATKPSPSNGLQNGTIDVSSGSTICPRSALLAKGRCGVTFEMRPAFVLPGASAGISPGA